MVRGDLGRSLWMKRPVLGEVLERFKATLILTGTALLLSTVGGIALGIASATRANSLLDRAERGRLALRREHAGLLARHRADGDLLALARLAARLRHVRAVRRRRAPRPPRATWCCPRVTLAAASVTIIARLTRSTMLEVLGQDYIRTARAKGAGRARAWWCATRCKNALIPIVTVVGVQAGYLLGGAVLTETVFAWPGVGTLDGAGHPGARLPARAGLRARRRADASSSSTSRSTCSTRGSTRASAMSDGPPARLRAARCRHEPPRRAPPRARASLAAHRRASRCAAPWLPLADPDAVDTPNRLQPAAERRARPRHRRVRPRSAEPARVGRARVAARRRGHRGGSRCSIGVTLGDPRRLLHGLDRERRDAAHRHPDGVSVHPARHRASWPASAPACATP